MVQTDKRLRGGDAAAAARLSEAEVIPSSSLPVPELEAATSSRAWDIDTYLRKPHHDFDITLGRDGSVEVGNFFGERVNFTPDGQKSAIAHVEAEVRIIGWSGRNSDRSGRIELSVDGHQMLSTAWPKSYHSAIDFDKRTEFRQMQVDPQTGDRIAIVDMTVEAVVKPDLNDPSKGMFQINPVVKVVPHTGPSDSFGFAYIKYEKGRQLN